MEKHLKHLRTVSCHLFSILEKIGASEYIRQTRRHSAVIEEILITVSQLLTEKHAFTYKFGSFVEGSTTPGLLSDIDTLLCREEPRVIEHLSEADKQTCFLIIQDENTPPGYTKLQLLENGEIPKPGVVQSEDEALDLNGQPVYLNKTLIEAMTNDERNGPAGTTLWRRGLPDLDYVPAFRCRKWPSCANKWFERKFEHNFPDSEMRKEFRKFGCFVVGVGQPSSPERDLQWRMSFSLQERKIMFNLNPVQFRCYVLMKMIKNDFIKPETEGKSLTSYHCKTCLFYTLENTQHCFWASENLVACLTNCLNTLKLWIENKYIPNYFIPEENMWKGTEAVRSTVVNILGKLLDESPGYLFRIKCDNVGKFLVKELGNTMGSGSIDHSDAESKTDNTPVGAECASNIDSTIDVNSSEDSDEDSDLVNAIVGALTMEEDNAKAIDDLCKAFPEAKEIIGNVAESVNSVPENDAENACNDGLQDRKLAESVDHQNSDGLTVNTRGTKTQNVLDDTYRALDITMYKTHFWTADAIIGSAKELIESTRNNDDIDACLDAHYSLVKWLKDIHSLHPYMEHTPLDYKVALQYLLPFLHTSIGSHLIVKARQTSDMYQQQNYLSDSATYFQNGLESDALSGRVKHAATLFMQGHLMECLAILEILDDNLERHVTTWGRCKKESTFINEDLCNRIRNKQLSTREVLQESIAACVMYLPTEADLVPKELQYEMYRSVCAQKPRREFRDNWYDFSVVDAAIYLHYLKYLIHERLGDDRSRDVSLAFLMGTLEYDVNIDHPDTANNLIGCILKKRGELSAAWQCFCESWQAQPDQNAAKWHMGVMLSETVADRRTSERRNEPTGFHEALDGDESRNVDVEVIYSRI